MMPNVNERITRFRIHPPVVKRGSHQKGPVREIGPGAAYQAPAPKMDACNALLPVSSSIGTAIHVNKPASGGQMLKGRIGDASGPVNSCYWHIAPEWASPPVRVARRPGSFCVRGYGTCNFVRRSQSSPRHSQPLPPKASNLRFLASKSMEYGHDYSKPRAGD